MKILSLPNRWRTVISSLIPSLTAMISIAVHPCSTAQTCGGNIVSNPNTTSPTNFLSDVTVIAANDSWAVGGLASGSRAANPLTEHWNGTTWTVVPAPQPPNTLAPCR